MRTSALFDAKNFRFLHGQGGGSIFRDFMRTSLWTLNIWLQIDNLLESSEQRLLKVKIVKICPRTGIELAVYANVKILIKFSFCSILLSKLHWFRSQIAEKF